MSQFVGIYEFDQGGRTVTGDFRLDELLSTFGSQSRRFSDSHLTVACRVGVADESTRFLETDSVVCALAGDLVLTGAPREGDSGADVDYLGRSADVPGLLQHANGTFAGFRYDRRTHALELFTDPLGARPLYYCRTARRLYFSSSMRVLETLPEVPKRVDIRGFVEQEAFCYPLGARTTFTTVKVLRDAEVLHVRDAGVHTSRYFRWDLLTPADDSPDALLDYCYEAFVAAVADRCQSGGPVRCLLSGGLDSRAIAGALIALGREVQAINYSLPGYQDAEYARRFADNAKLALRLVSVDFEAIGTTAGSTTAGLLRTVLRGETGRVFSGDGGGETIGFLMMAPDVLAAMNAGGLEQAAKAYVNNGWVFPARIAASPEVAAHLNSMPQAGMLEELQSMRQLHPEKRLQLFLLRNDLRCHLHEHFEEADRLGVELLLPFYDKRVLESVLRIAPPLAPYLGHRFYHKWLSRFPPVVTSVPWQTYKNHEPCPVVDSEPSLPDQRAMVMRNMPIVSRRRMRQAVATLFESTFPATVLRRWPLLAAAVMHSLRIRDYRYVFKTYINLSRLTRVSGEKSSLERKVPSTTED